MTTQTIVAPFGVEADHPRNADLLLQSIPGRLRLRSAVSASKPSYKGTIPKDQARHLGSLPPLPGMQIHVNPARLTYTVTDPMHDDEELCDRLQRALEADDRPLRFSGKLRGVPPRKGTLDPHYMKTLCRELYWIVKAGEGRVVRGSLPELEDIEKLPGKFLLNPGATIPNTQPRYEEDYEAWKENLTKVGG